MTYDEMNECLDALRKNNNLRTIPAVRHEGRFVIADGRKMLNLSSNDYLGLASDRSMKEEFADSISCADCRFGSTSSRLLTGNYEVMNECENLLARMYGTESALVFDSGYHANSGILPAISGPSTLILADKLVHASIIDGLQLSRGKVMRFRHNDFQHAESLIERYAESFNDVIIVTESIFSMDGDVTDLKRLVAIKNKYREADVKLYVDEAHAFGVRGRRGLGVCEEQGVTGDVDFIVGTFGKAVNSVGAFVACNETAATYLVNKARTLIFTTALPPVCWQWTLFVLHRMADFDERRNRLEELWQRFKSVDSRVASHIIPVIMGSSEDAVRKASELRQNGFYVLPVRPPSVPEGTSRLRISLTAGIEDEEMYRLITLLKEA